MDSSEPQASGEVPAVVGQRPETGGQGNNSECKHSSPFPCPPACTRDERRPRHTSSSGDELKARHHPNRRKASRNRRVPGASSGGPHDNDGRLRPEMPCRPPVGGDRQIADCSAANLGTATSRSLSASICVICGFLARLGGLRVFASSCLRCPLCFSLCLCAFVVLGLRVRSVGI